MKVRNQLGLVKVVAFLLILMGVIFSTLSCGKEKVYSYKDLAINYDAQTAYIHYEKLPELEDVGSAVVYREVDDIEKFVAHQTVPVLLVQVKKSQAATIKTITYLEKLAENSKDNVAIVKADSDSEDEFFKHYSITGWPAFYLIDNGKKVAEFYGYSDEIQEQIAEYLR